jgi:hypothetical protein
MDLMLAYLSRVEQFIKREKKAAQKAWEEIWQRNSGEALAG